MYVKIEKNPDGSHSFQSGGLMDKGWAYVPPNIARPKTIPFVNIEVAEVHHPAVMGEKRIVVKGRERTVPVTLIPEYTQIEVISMTEGTVV